MLLTWSDDLMVGHARMDEDHRTMVGLLNDLHEAMLQGRGKGACARMLGELIARTRTHFAMEEQMMVANRYPEVETHRLQHVKLIKDAMELKARFDDGSTTSVPESAMEFLKDWMVQHMGGADRVLALALAAGRR